MAASFVTLFILYATIIRIDTRKLSVSIDGNLLNFRRNILYLTWKDAKDYRIFCGPPPGEWDPLADNVFTWTPLTKAGYGTVIPGPNNATLAIRSTFDETVLQFNCTMKVLPNNYEAITFKIYKTDQYVLTDPAPMASEIRLNYTIGNLSMSPLRLVCRPPSSPQRNLEHSQIVWFLDDVEVKDDEKR
uniref:Uncharacterized protein n=1 Tax=Romanomermis culicivorax TaxID=13658 RepID=A0A915JY25_ROMCU